MTAPQQKEEINMVTSKILIKQLKKELIELQTACTAIESSI